MVYCEAKRILEAYEKKEGSIQSLINKSLYQKVTHMASTRLVSWINNKILFILTKSSGTL